MNWQGESLSKGTNIDKACSLEEVYLTMVLLSTLGLKNILPGGFCAFSGKLDSICCLIKCF